MERDALEGMMQQLPTLLATLPSVAFVAAAYFFITLDRQRATSPSKDDTQVGIKLVLFALILAGIGIALGGVNILLSYALSGFKGGAGPIKVAIPPNGGRVTVKAEPFPATLSAETLPP